MNAEELEQLLSDRDRARDEFQRVHSKLVLQVIIDQNQNIRAARKDTVALIEHRDEAPAPRKLGRPPKKVEEASARKFPAPFRSATGPKILELLGKGSKTFPQISAVFEKEMSTLAVHSQLDNLRGLNYVDREGDGYALKPAGRAWLNQNGEGK